MKKILIVGSGSYIGESFAKYFQEKYPGQYLTETVGTLHEEWKTVSFAGYDAVFDVAGIAHQKETKENAPLYYAINRDLTVSVAQKAKEDGVKLFVYLSSMSVYGMAEGKIDASTKAAPTSNYGKSKLEAEEGLNRLATDDFKVCVLRPPMVYGAGCKGNFQTVISLVRRSPIFPKVNNQRSSIHVNNLCEEVKQIIDQGYCGYSFPQDSEYLSTTVMAQEIAETLGKKIRCSSLLGLCVRLMKPFSLTVRKAFGSLVYVKEMPNCNQEYKPTMIKDSVIK